MLFWKKEGKFTYRRRLVATGTLKVKRHLPVRSEDILTQKGDIFFIGQVRKQIIF